MDNINAPENTIPESSVKIPEVSEVMFNEREYKRITPEVKKEKLGDAIAYRIHFTLGDASQAQIHLIEALRRNNIIAVEENTDTVLGFIQNANQMEQLQKAIAALIETSGDQELDGRCGFGGSRGDSRLWIASDPGQGKEAVILTCEATNAAARQEDSETALTLRKLTGVQSPDDLELYRYMSPEEQLETAGYIRGATGAKGTRLGVMEFGTYKDKLSQTPFVPSPDIFPVSIETRKQVELQNVEQLAVLNIDVNNFSKYVHEKTALLESLKWQRDDYMRRFGAQGSSSGEGDLDWQKTTAETIQKLEADIENFLLEIASFFTTLEDIVRDLVKEQMENSQKQKMTPESNDDESIKRDKEKLMTIDWRGDAGGILVPEEYKDELIIGLRLTLLLFPNLKVKASILHHNQLRAEELRGRLVLNNEALDEVKAAEKKIKEHVKGNNQLQNSSIILTGEDVFTPEEEFQQLLELGKGEKLTHTVQEATHRTRA